MNFVKDRRRWGGSRNALVIWLGITILGGLLVIVVMFTSIFDTPRQGELPYAVWLLIAGVFLALGILLLWKTIQLHDAAGEVGSKLDRIAVLLEKTSEALGQVDQGVRLNEMTKSLAFDNENKEALGQAVVRKLDQEDFSGAFAMIDKLADQAAYKSLAEQLRLHAHKRREAADEKWISRAVADVEGLFDSYEWLEAAAEIERLTKAYPENEQIGGLGKRLLEEQRARKKALLASWHEAVGRKETDRSLEILKELDLYLLPEEGLALQEAAKDIFKSKLHSLGTQFSLAVSEKSWAKAAELGEEIARDFPNSRMAEEIRAKMDVLRQKLAQPGF
ncbi:MAG: hypothetical protein ACYTEL_21885 [Planctomycetota bacterium]|jgi:hypothetical protein